MFYNCNDCPNRLCSHYIVSTSLTVVTVDGVDTLLIDIPAGTYNNCEKYCLIIAQTRPANVTVDMPVAISIGGNTTTVYPLICGRTCLQAVGCQVSGRSRVQVYIQTNTTSGVFKAVCGLGRYCPTVLSSLPVVTPAVATAEVASITPTEVQAMSNAKNVSKTVTTKTVLKAE